MTTKKPAAKKTVPAVKKPATVAAPAAVKKPVPATKAKPVAAPAAVKKPVSNAKPLAKTSAKATAKPAAVEAPAPVVAAAKVVRTTEKAYLPAAERRNRLDATVLKLLKKDGIAKLTRTAVAAAAGCSNSLLTIYYTNAAGLRVSAVQSAVLCGDLKTARKAIADGFDVKTLSRKAQAMLKTPAAPAGA